MYEKGLQVYTSLDLTLQKAARSALTAGLARINKGRTDATVEGAVLAIENRSGQILAMVRGVGLRSHEVLNRAKFSVVVGTRGCYPLDRHNSGNTLMPPTVGSLVSAAEAGDHSVAAVLFATLYSELHRLAKRELRREQGANLGVTTLLHEAYISMASRDGISFPDRPRFMQYAARVMRGVIIEHARSRRALKRGGRFEITSLGTDDPQGTVDVVDHRELSRLSDALDGLAGVDAGLAQTVDLKFFCGFSFGEIAAMQGISERTVQRNWEKARIYLRRTLKGASPPACD